MKKIITSIMLLAALFVAVPAQAKLFNFGIEGGLNMTKARFSKDAFNSDNRTGFFIGPKIQMTIPLVGLGLDAAVLYSQKKLNSESENVEASKTLSMIAVPINLRYTIGFSSLASLYVATGPEFGINTGSKMWNDFELNNTNFSWNIGAGVTLLNHLQVGVGYNIALGNYGETKEADAMGVMKSIDLKANTFFAKVGYLF